METKIYNIDCMKYRKSTHLAGVDVEMIIAEKGKCVLTIKEAYYSKNVDVSGNKTDGYFLEFQEDVNPMVVNSTNRKTIASIIKTSKNFSAVESRNLTNWIGQKIELYFDENVKMMGKLVGGIKVKLENPTPQISDKNALSILNNSKTLNELKDNWEKLTAQEKQLPTVIALKDNLKTTLK